MKSTNLDLFYVALIPLTLLQTALSHPVGNGRIRIASTNDRYSPMALTISDVQPKPGPPPELTTSLYDAREGPLAAAKETSAAGENLPPEPVPEGVEVEVWEWVIGGCRNIRESCDMLHRCCMGYSCIGQRLPPWADPMRHGHCGIVL
ncbi:hypothetical protein HOY82DRAFT_568352 [Tuber indicum]|nr:hypothetical protein HOY82DRAFT_568352 [Tuber indicum]